MEPVIDTAAIRRAANRGDWGSRVMFDHSAESTIYYLETGERRSFVPYGGANSYNSPFTATNNSRIAFHPNQLNLAILAKDNVSIWLK